MKKIIIELICILLLFTGCMGCKTEPTYIVIPEKDERTPPISIISLMNARSFYNIYTFASTTYKPSIDEVWKWNTKTVVVKEWNGYYYSKHMIAEHPEWLFYIFYDKYFYGNDNMPVFVYCYFVIPISSEEVCEIQVGDSYSKFQEQYGDFPDFEGLVEVVHSDGEILFCRIDFNESKIVEVRPGLPSRTAPIIKEILKFEANAQLIKEILEFESNSQ